MKTTTTLIAIAVLVAATSARATQETFTTAGPLDCSAIAYCVQNTSDNPFTLRFVPTYPTSAPSATSFNVTEQSIEIAPASGGLLDLSIMQVALTALEFYAGVTFLGTIQLDAQDTAGTWRNVKAIHLSRINGATAFRVGMLNLTAH